jgi:hypothetical protein
VPGAGPICFRPRSHAPVCPDAATIGCSADPVPAGLPHPYPIRHLSGTCYGAGYVPVAVPDRYTTQTLGAGPIKDGTTTGTRPAASGLRVRPLRYLRCRTRRPYSMYCRRHLPAWVRQARLFPMCVKSNDHNMSMLKALKHA